ncbi:MAG TPA: c-type cytochrome [Acidimicrobiales bacterium]|nr:c-type cytochrome [Acidimicrobiales bacterium]
MIGAISQQQKIGVAVLVVMIVGWLVYLFIAARRTYEPGSEMELAPNRKPYLDDEALEGSRLTKYLWWAFASLAITAVALPAYWLREPSRQEGAGLDRGTQFFEDTSIKRGREYFEVSPGDPPTPREPHYGCERCHGVEGIGGVADYTLSDPVDQNAPARQVKWVAPALNTALLRYRPAELANIIIYGRAGTPMPPWGVAGGGALNEQQVEDLVAYITSIQLDPAEVKAANLTEFGTDGKKVFDGMCARCHTEGYSYGEAGVPGGGAFGPSLVGGSTLRQFPDITTQIEWVEKTAELGKQYGVRGQSKGVMPHFGDMLTAEQIKAVVDYERTL